MTPRLSCSFRPGLATPIRGACRSTKSSGGSRGGISGVASFGWAASANRMDVDLRAVEAWRSGIYVGAMATWGRYRPTPSHLAVEDSGPGGIFGQKVTGSSSARVRHLKKISAGRQLGMVRAEKGEDGIFRGPATRPFWRVRLGPPNRPSGQDIDKVNPRELR